MKPMKSNQALKIALLTTTACVLLSGAARAQDQDATPSKASLTVDERIARLEQELETLKRQRETDQEVSQAAADKIPAVTIDKKGFKAVSLDGNYELSIGGTFYAEAHGFSHDGGVLRDEIVDRLIRPVISGRAGNASFRLVPEFGGSSVGSASLVDAYIDYKFSDAVQFRFGKVTPPIGLERIQSNPDLVFTERGHSTNLVPNRDVGFQVFGPLVPGVLESAIGEFIGGADLANVANDLDNRKDVIYRVFATPFANSDIVSLQGLGIGYAGSSGQRTGSATVSNLGTYKTPGQQDFFRYNTGVFANGLETRSNPEAYFYLNNFGLLADYVTTSQIVKSGLTQAKLHNQALDVSASWVVTGEALNFKGGVHPKSSFSLNDGNWGAVELAVRYGYTHVDPQAFGIYANAATSARKATSVGYGVSWYISDNLKTLFDYDITKFVGGAITGNRATEKYTSARAQFRF